MFLRQHGRAHGDIAPLDRLHSLDAPGYTPCHCITTTMPLYNDFRDLMQRSKADEVKHIHEQRAQVIPRLKDITYKAQTIVDHPGWQFFLDSLASRVHDIETERQRIASAMILGPSLGQDLERQKLALNKCDRELAGLRYAATLIPQAVDLGQKVAQTIAGESSRAAAGSIAG